MRREAEQEALLGIALRFVHELAEVPLAAQHRVGGACVADVRVVRPHDDACGAAALTREVLVELVQGVGHVLVAQVPRVGPTVEHRAVVSLGIAHHARVLLRIEQLVGGGRAVVPQEARGVGAQLAQLLNGLAPAVVLQAEVHCVAIGLRIVRQLVEATVAGACTLRCIRVGVREVGEHRMHRLAQAVQVESEKAHLRRRLGHAGIALAQPV